MLDQMTRAAILRLREEGHGTRSIAKAVGISRGAVREVLRAGTAEVPRLERPELGEAHRKVQCPGPGRATLPEHRPPRGQGGTPAVLAVEERQLLEAAPQIAGYVAALKQRASGRGTVALRRLQRLLRDYPRRPVLEAIRAAETYGLFDLERLERMVLRGIARDFFPPAGGDEGPDHE